VPSSKIALPLLAVAAMGAGTLVARRTGYDIGLHTTVRCREGHLFTTIWIPGVKLKAIDLGVVRYQRCPVGKNWTFVVPVKPGSLTDAERAAARRHRDVRLP
jgi:hypothetical protein